MLTPVDDRPADSHRRFAGLCAQALRLIHADAAGLNLTSYRTGLPLVFSAGLPTGTLQQQLNSTEHVPVRDAILHNRLILIEDLTDPEPMARFPDYARLALASCIRSVSVIPLSTPTARLGTLDLYRYSPGPLSSTDLAAALVYAVTITDLLLTEPTDHHPCLPTAAT